MGALVLWTFLAGMQDLGRVTQTGFELVLVARLCHDLI